MTGGGEMPNQRVRHSPAADRGMIGNIFGRLRVLEEAGRNASRNILYKCICECEEIVIVTGSNLRNGHSKSCGCLVKETHTKVFLKHGMMDTPEYKSWYNMKSRCFNKNNEAYSDYGGRGITVCDRWKESFEAFYEDMGNKPDKTYTIERIDVNGNYEPDNCKWDTREKQGQNRRLMSHSKTGVNGVTLRDGKYHVSLTHRKKRHHIGVFKTIEEAVKARKEAEETYWRKLG